MFGPVFRIFVEYSMPRKSNSAELARKSRNVQESDKMADLVSEPIMLSVTGIVQELMTDRTSAQPSFGICVYTMRYISGGMQTRS